MLLKSLDFKDLENKISHKGINVKIEKEDESWTLENPIVHQIFNKLHHQSITLNRLFKGKIYRGIITGFNDVFIINRKTKYKLIEKDPKSEDIIKPYLRGKGINRYSIEWQGNYVLLTQNGINVHQEYPAVFEYLSQYQKQLEKRFDQGEHWYNLRACSYYRAFEQNKILWGNLASRASFAYDEESFYVNAPACIAPTDYKWILPILNSKLIDFFLKKQAIQRRGGYIEQKPIYVKEIPVPQISESEQQPFTEEAELMLDFHKKFHEEIKNFINFIESSYTPKKISAKLQKFYTLSFSELVQELKKQNVSLTSEDEATLRDTFDHIRAIQAEITSTDREIDRMVYDLYGLTEEEIRIVEGEENEEL